MTKGGFPISWARQAAATISQNPLLQNLLIFKMPFNNFLTNKRCLVSVLQMLQDYELICYVYNHYQLMKKLVFYL